MKIYIEPIGKLINEFSKLPGVGAKTAQRFAYKVVNMTNEEANAFANAILNVKQNVRYCKICGNFSEKEVCEGGSIITSSRTYYKCHGNFIFKSGGKSYYAYHREFKENVIFETKEQAEEYIVKNIDKIMKDLVTKIIHLCGPITYKTKKDVVSAENYSIVKLTRQYLKELRNLANR